MSAAGAPVPARPRRAGRVPSLAAARLLRLELRRNAMLWMVPLGAALFWFATYRPGVALPPLWNLRGAMLQQQALLGFAPLVAGAAAWMGSREGRRGVSDLVRVTAMPRWAGQLATWAATACWAIVVYLGCAAVLYGVTARQVTGGAPLWWPVAVGATVVATCCAIGFAAGALLPGRFTPPLAAVAVFLALGAGAIAIEHNSTYAQIWPLSVQGPLPPDSFGVFYPYLPDLAIAQVMFLAGLAAAALGAPGLRVAAGGRWLRRAAAVAVAAGLLAAGSGIGLAGTARLEAHGMVIPALHNAASDKPIAYTPVCGHAAVPVCLHPAYRSLLPAVTAALGPVLGQVAGLPGTPARVSQAAVARVRPSGGNGVEIGIGGQPVSGSPPVFQLLLDGPLPGQGTTTTAGFIDQVRSRAAAMIFGALIGGDPRDEPGPRDGQGSAQEDQGAMAQRAILVAMAKVAGVVVGNEVPALEPGSPSDAAAQRFAALSPAARHAWLAAHLTALRAGRISLREIP